MPKRSKRILGLSKRKNGFSTEDIIDLVHAMDENRLTEISVNEHRRSLTIKRSQGSQNNDSDSATNETAQQDSETEGKTYKAITSPAVGIIHLSPNSGSTHFVSEGQVVEPGQVVGLIETLKVMSEVKCDTHGRVVSIEVNNGDMVEFGQTLLLYEVID